MLRMLGLGLILSAFLVPAAEAQSSDPRADDAVELFASYCVATAGTRELALSKFDAEAAPAKRLPDEIVAQMQGGKAGGVGWAMRSPNNAELIIEYTALGMCGLHLRAADEPSVKAAFEAAMGDAAKEAGAELAAQPEETQDIDGTTTTRRVWTFPLNGQTARLALTTAGTQVRGQQHFMTFSFGE